VHVCVYFCCYSGGCLCQRFQGAGVVYRLCIVGAVGLSGDKQVEESGSVVTYCWQEDGEVNRWVETRWEKNSWMEE
jgi:hypothetical protein